MTKDGWVRDMCVTFLPCHWWPTRRGVRSGLAHAREELIDYQTSHYHICISKFGT